LWIEMLMCHSQKKWKFYSLLFGSYSYFILWVKIMKNTFSQHFFNLNIYMYASMIASLFINESWVKRKEQSVYDLR
jgi:hypothetical protein